MADETTTTNGAGGAPADTGAAGATGTPAPAASGAGEGGAAPAGEGKVSPPAADAAGVAAPPAEKPAEGKAEGEPKAGDKAGDKAETKGGEATYEYSGLNIPDAWKGEGDTIWQDAQKLLADAKVSHEDAQKFIDFTLERDKLIAKGVNDASVKAWNDQAEAWKAEVTKTYSPQELAGARKAVEQLFDKEGVQYLEALRLTDNPAFVKAMVKVSQAISEDTFVPGNAAASAPRDARVMFPNSKMNP